MVFLINVSGFATQFTGATLDLAFGSVTDVASFSDGAWSISQGNIQLPSGADGDFLFTFENVAPPTPEDPANLDLGLTVTAGSDGNDAGTMTSWTGQVDSVTVYDFLGNIVPSVSAVSGLGNLLPSNGRGRRLACPRAFDLGELLLGLAGLGFAGYGRTRGRKVAARVAN